jgi:hypothetical protein
MTATADLNKVELSAKITDAAVKTWWDATPALPSGADMSELFAKLLQAAAVAQIAKNNLNTTALTGELLNSYPLPTTGTVETDPVLNIQTFDSTYQLNVISVAGLDTSGASYA